MTSREPELDARTAALVAAGMKAVALADGDAHPEELALIEGFERSIPCDVDIDGLRLADDVHRDVLVRSMVAVALADGRITDEERATIAEIAHAHGVEADRVRAVEREVKAELLGQLAGVTVFREDALRIASALGFSPEEADTILSGSDD